MLTLFRNSSIDFEIRGSFEIITVIEILIRLLEAERYVKPEPFSWWTDEQKKNVTKKKIKTEKQKKNKKKGIRISEISVEIHNYLL